MYFQPRELIPPILFMMHISPNNWMPIHGDGKNVGEIILYVSVTVGLSLLYITSLYDSHHWSPHMHIRLYWLTAIVQPYHLHHHSPRHPPSFISSQKGYMMRRAHAELQLLIPFLSAFLHLRVMIWKLCQVFDLTHLGNFIGLSQKVERASYNACVTMNSRDPSQMFTLKLQNTQQGDVNNRLME